MAVPASLRNRLDAVDEFLKTAPEINPAAPPLNTRDAPPAQPVASPPIDDAQIEAGDTPPATGEPSPRTAEEWNRLTGKVSALQRQINERDDTIAKLTQELVLLRQRPQRTAPPAMPAPADLNIELPDGTDEVFGAEGASILRTVANSAAQAALNSVAPQVQRTSEDAYEAAVVAAVPEIDQINAMPEFQAWLATPDSLTGRKPADLFDQAAQSLNSSECIRLYRYFQEHVAPATARATAKPSASKLPLNERVSPGAKPTDGPGNAQPKPVYTRSEYQQTQQKLTHKRSSLTPQEYVELRARFEDMQRAAVEGRLVG